MDEPYQTTNPTQSCTGPGFPNVVTPTDGLNEVGDCGAVPSGSGRCSASASYVSFSSISGGKAGLINNFLQSRSPLHLHRRRILTSVLTLDHGGVTPRFTINLRGIYVVEDGQHPVSELLHAP
ncbi:hypothetical protein LINPERHAP1_LOCUS15547 [Linum perenne]